MTVFMCLAQLDMLHNTASHAPYGVGKTSCWRWVAPVSKTHMLWAKSCAGLKCSHASLYVQTCSTTSCCLVHLYFVQHVYPPRLLVASSLVARVSALGQKTSICPRLMSQHVIASWHISACEPSYKADMCIVDSRTPQCESGANPLHILQDAEAGLRSYGYITGIKAYGIFVSFFGGVKGLAHTAELPLAPEQTPKDAYRVGQVVKCRILSTDFSHQRLKLSLMGKKSSAEGGEEVAGGEDPLGGLQPGDVVKGRVREIESTEVYLRYDSLLLHCCLSTYCP